MDFWRPIEGKPHDLKFWAIYDADNQLLGFRGADVEFCVLCCLWRKIKWAILRKKPKATHYYPLPDTEQRQ